MEANGSVGKTSVSAMPLSNIRIAVSALREQVAVEQLPRCEVDPVEQLDQIGETEYARVKHTPSVPRRSAAGCGNEKPTDPRWS